MRRPARLWCLLCLLIPVTARAQQRPRDLDLVLSAIGFERLAWRESPVHDTAQWFARAGISLDAFAREDWGRFRFIDLDADGRPDIVFDGGHGAGADGVETHIYRNAGTRFDRAMFAETSIYALGHLPSEQAPVLALRAEPFGMCDVSDRTLQIVHRTSPPDTTPYVLVDAIRYGTAGSRWPRTALATPLSIRVTQDRYNLRSAPVLDDTTDFGDCEEHHGNVFAVLPLGTTARALAQEQVGARLWYFIMTEPGVTVAWPGDRGGETMRARLVGWISSRWTETIPRAPPPR